MRLCLHKRHFTRSRERSRPSKLFERKDPIIELIPCTKKTLFFLVLKVSLFYHATPNHTPHLSQLLTKAKALRDQQREPSSSGRFSDPSQIQSHPAVRLLIDAGETLYSLAEERSSSLTFEGPAAFLVAARLVDCLQVMLFDVALASPPLQALAARLAPFLVGLTQFLLERRTWPQAAQAIEATGSLLPLALRILSSPPPSLSDPALPIAAARVLYNLLGTRHRTPVVRAVIADQPAWGRVLENTIGLPPALDFSAAPTPTLPRGARPLILQIVTVLAEIAPEPDLLIIIGRALGDRPQLIQAAAYRSMLARYSGPYEAALLLRLVSSYAIEPRALTRAAQTPGFLRSLINNLAPSAAAKLNPQDPAAIYSLRLLASLALYPTLAAKVLSLITPLAPEEFVWRLLRTKGWEPNEQKCLVVLLFLSDDPDGSTPFSDARLEYLRKVVGSQRLVDLCIFYASSVEDRTSTLNGPFYVLAKELALHPRLAAVIDCEPLCKTLRARLTHQCSVVPQARLPPSPFLREPPPSNEGQGQDNPSPASPILVQDAPPPRANVWMIKELCLAVQSVGHTVNQDWAGLLEVAESLPDDSPFALCPRQEDAAVPEAPPGLETTPATPRTQELSATVHGLKKNALAEGRSTSPGSQSRFIQEALALVIGKPRTASSADRASAPLASSPMQPPPVQPAPSMFGSPYEPRLGAPRMVGSPMTATAESPRSLSKSRTIFSSGSGPKSKFGQGVRPRSSIGRLRSSDLKLDEVSKLRNAPRTPLALSLLAPPGRADQGPSLRPGTAPPVAQRGEIEMEKEIMRKWREMMASLSLQADDEIGSGTSGSSSLRPPSGFPSRPATATNQRPWTSASTNGTFRVVEGAAAWSWGASVSPERASSPLDQSRPNSSPPRKLTPMDRLRTVILKEHETPSSSCWYCGSFALLTGTQLKKCRRCIALYCSIECAMIDWGKRHKHECRYLKEEPDKLVWKM